MGLKDFFLEKLGIKRKKKKPDSIEHSNPARIKYFFHHIFHIPIAR